MTLLSPLRHFGGDEHVCLHNRNVAGVRLSSLLLHARRIALNGHQWLERTVEQLEDSTPRLPLH